MEEKINSDGSQNRYSFSDKKELIEFVYEFYHGSDHLEYLEKAIKKENKYFLVTNDFLDRYSLHEYDDVRLNVNNEHSYFISCSYRVPRSCRFSGDVEPADWIKARLVDNKGAGI